MALCVAYGFASAQAAIFSAAEAARFHTGERHMYPRPARLRLVKLRFARLPLRETLLPRHPDDARSALAIPAPRAPSCRSIMRGRRRSKPAMPRLRRPRLSSTQFCSRAFPLPCLPSVLSRDTSRKERPSLIRLIWFVPGRFLVRRLSELTHPPKCSIARFLMSPRIFAVVPLVCAACWTLLAGVRRGLTLRGADMPFPGPGLWPRPGRDGTAALHACTVLFPHAKRTIPVSTPP